MITTVAMINDERSITEVSSGITVVENISMVWVPILNLDLILTRFPKDKKSKQSTKTKLPQQLSHHQISQCLLPELDLVVLFGYYDFCRITLDALCWLFGL